MKILVAVDGSKYGRWATEWVRQLPLSGKPAVTALHVVDVTSLRSPVMVQAFNIGNEMFIQKEIERMQAHARRVTAQETKLLASLHLKGRVVSRSGQAASTILERCPGHHGLVVVGSHGLDAVDRFMLGSVSNKVTLHAPCSVLVVKQPARPIRRVLLATDGSKASSKALQFLIREIKPRTPAGTIEVLLVHVLPSLPHSKIKDRRETFMHASADKLKRAGFRVSEAWEVGRPAEEIIKIGDRRKMDLLVTGAKGLGAMARFLLGSVSTKLVQHSHCAVLVVR